MTDENPAADAAARAAVAPGSPREPVPPAASEPRVGDVAAREPLPPSASEPPTDDVAAGSSQLGARGRPEQDDSGAAEPAASVADGTERPAAVSRDRVTVRRSPRYGRFMVLGIGAGTIVTFVLTNLFDIDPDVGFGALFGYLLLFGVPIGAAIGGLLAVLIDAVTSRRAKTLEAERTTVDPTPEEIEGDLED